MSFIEAKDVHLTYTTGAKPLEVLKGIDLTIDEGESLAILGASGAGKSTFLHILGTLEVPSSGRVFFEGKDIFRYSEAQISEFRSRTIGFVFQFHHLLPMLNAEENIMLPCLIGGSNKKAAKQRASDLLERIKLSGRAGHRPSELSGGEQQRVALARALAMKPRILLADEPTGNLDSQTGEEMTELMLELKNETGMTLVIVTHNEQLAARLSHRVRLADGRVGILN